jgi:hypothetical protein
MRSKLATPLGARHSPLSVRTVTSGRLRSANIKMKRAVRSETASKTFPNLINSLIQRAESGVNASVMKAEQIGKY